MLRGMERGTTFSRTGRSPCPPPPPRARAPWPQERHRRRRRRRPPGQPPPGHRHLRVTTSHTRFSTSCPPRVDQFSLCSSPYATGLPLLRRGVRSCCKHAPPCPNPAAPLRRSGDPKGIEEGWARTGTDIPRSHPTRRDAPPGQPQRENTRPRRRGPGGWKNPRAPEDLVGLDGVRLAHERPQGSHPAIRVARLPLARPTATPARANGPPNPNPDSDCACSPKPADMLHGGGVHGTHVV